MAKWRINESKEKKKEDKAKIQQNMAKQRALSSARTSVTADQRQLGLDIYQLLRNSVLDMINKDYFMFQYCK